MECGRGLEVVINLSKMIDYMVESANCHYSYPIDLSIVLHGDAMLAVDVLADRPEEIN